MNDKDVAQTVVAPLSVVIPTYSRTKLLHRAITSLLAQTTGPPQIVVVDNDSPTNIGEMIQEEYGACVDVIRLNHNMFFCGAVNHGVEMSRGEIVAVLNDDCWVEPSWAEEILQTFAQDSSIGSVATLVFRDGRGTLVDSAGTHLNLSGLACGIGWNKPASELPSEQVAVFSAAGACAAYRRDLFRDAGGFDERFIAYFDDVDLGFRLQLLGFKCVFNPACRAFHLGGATPKARNNALYLVERNMLWTVAKNLPTGIVRRHWGSIIAAHSQPAPILDGSTRRAWAAGKVAAVVGMQTMLAERRRIQADIKVSETYIEELLLSKKIGVCHL